MRPKAIGNFAGAHHFALNSPYMYDITTNHYHMRADTLQPMVPFVIEGAEFDSSERAPPPRCHPGTRQDIMGAILAWRNNNSRAKRLLWLNGPAGIGKSAIIQTLAEAEAEAVSAGTGKLGATLFISRSNERNESNRVLATIAYQLAVKDPTYRAYITERMTADPRILGKSMTEQFKLLIAQPFGELALQPPADEDHAWSIYLDGLDECNNEDAQCRLVELIGAFVLQYPEAPLVWIIASRPEKHLQDLFAREDIVPSFHQVTIPVNSDEACRDVERYLRTEFTKIKDKHPYLIPATCQWPTETQFLTLGCAASGLFIFASTVVRFVDTNPAPQINPMTQLKLVLALIK
ncbi:hypothetical protein P691DRAFT_538919 [Macrolepiota fuliginosa MF-IS2]|uniref:NACHT domain-containing protein n=1 Tax=Macrolepiota fuliginosa MF-IS2 TaxID=1400762 RepID=A0A9P5X075_9AGAR|nr:hypothetical protein P691DRAFT_538919 [Macrolepiota fuliginosa MF-IS2]